MNPLPLPSIDLHGLRPEDALRRLEQGLHTARAAGRDGALVICGRGIGNRTGTPVLRQRILVWLRGPAGRRLGVSSVTTEAKGGALRVRFGTPK